MTIAWLIIAVVFGIAILTFVSLLSRRTSKLKITEYRERWEKIVTYLASEDTYSIAIIEADKLLDKALKELRFKGATMAERMVSAKKVFSKRDHVWLAHKLRNKIAHETDTKVNKRQTQIALGAYHRALKDLGAI
ncbi:hypothetical protein KC878_01815 [Candidatus Saccharibacteria bacterium]|nr:hypothetical protein [Candidatus Saccharibacteria bacterium]MCB9821616.1 hypothetical protein [Candidatus Nomurabacteria bacterium]